MVDGGFASSQLPTGLYGGSMAARTVVLQCRLAAGAIWRAPATSTFVQVLIIP